MKAIEIEKKTYDLIDMYIKENNLSIYDIIYEKRGKSMYLSIYIDKLSGISIEDCENLNNYINPILDNNLDISEPYLLEISSPGLERRIRTNEQLRKNISLNISISLFKPFKNSKQFIGILKEFDDKNICIICNNQEYILDKKNISIIRSVYNWEN